MKRKQVTNIQQILPTAPASSATHLIQNPISPSPSSAASVLKQVTKSTPQLEWIAQFHFTKALRMEIAPGPRDDCLVGQFHEEYYSDFKAFAEFPFNSIFQRSVIDIFWSHSWCPDHSYTHV